jgi:alkanesulfonate monooxygenase SsuD/methylene tetrahydromethanopterin reductase-like flavin-dependent oxidoreductase (luciferase family)
VRRGRDPTTLQLSILVGVLCGRDLSELEERAVGARGVLGPAPTSTAAAPLDELPSDWIVGTPEEVCHQLNGFGSLGVKRIMLWPPLHHDLEMVSLIGREVLPAVAAG